MERVMKDDIPCAPKVPMSLHFLEMGIDRFALSYVYIKKAGEF